MAGRDPHSGGARARPQVAVLPAGGRLRGHGLTLDPAAFRETLAGYLATEIDRRRPFLLLPVCFAAGIVAYFSAEIEPGIAAPAIGMLASAAAAIGLRRRFAAQALALALLCLFAGFGAGILRTRQVAAPVLATPVFLSIEGRIEAIDWNGQGGRMIVRLHDVAPAIERMPERVRLTFRGRPEIESGQGVRVRARLSPPGRASVPGGFDFQREAYFRRLGAVGFTTGQILAAPDLPPMALDGRLAAAIDEARNRLTRRIIDSIGGSTGAIAAALVTGKRGMIPEPVNDDLRAAGIYHIVSISGLHMVLAAGLFFWGARTFLTAIPGLALRRPIKKWAAVVAMLGAIAYCIFSGSEVATERSLIMTLVMFAAILFDRPALAMRNLAIAGLIVLALEPETLLGPSFQMSFSAVAGLVAYGEWERLRHRAGPAATTHAGWLGQAARRLLVGVVITSIIAGLATAPFQAFHFHRLNPYGVLGNALAIPLCSFVVMPAALAGVVLLPFGLDAPVWWVMGQGVAGIEVFAAWVAGLGGAVALVPRFGTGAMLLMALGIAVAAIFTVPLFRATGLVIALTGAFLVIGTERPALILDGDGRAALARGADGRMSLIGRQRPLFALAQWLPGDKDGRGPRDPSLSAGSACDRAGCVGRLADGRAIAVVLDATAFGEDCERAAIIVTPLLAPSACRDHALVYDRDYFVRSGATYLFARGNAFHAETARNVRQDRPWSPRPTSTTTSAPPLAPAAAMPVQPWDIQSADEQPQ